VNFEKALPYFAGLIGGMLVAYICLVDTRSTPVLPPPPAGRVEQKALAVMALDKPIVSFVTVETFPAADGLRRLVITGFYKERVEGDALLAFDQVCTMLPAGRKP
jgi:hypothetical protein